MKNSTTVFIFFRIRYFVYPKIVTNESPVFGPGKKAHLLFPSDTGTINFTVFNASPNPPSVIKNSTVLTNEPICYDITQTGTLIQCVSVPC